MLPELQATVRMESPFGVSFLPVSAMQISFHVCMRPFVQMPLGKQQTLDFDALRQGNNSELVVAHSVREGRVR